MATKKRKWTTEEDELIFKTVRENFYNLQKGFKKLAAKINRTAEAVSQRWYSTLSNPKNKGYVDNVCFVTFGLMNGAYHNRKNYVEGASIVTPLLRK